MRKLKKIIRPESWAGAIQSRLETFPCTKRNHSDDQVPLNIIQQRA